MGKAFCLDDFQDRVPVLQFSGRLDQLGFISITVHISPYGNCFCGNAANAYDLSIPAKIFSEGYCLRGGKRMTNQFI